MNGNTLDVIVAIDSEGILNAHIGESGKPATPTSVDHEYIYAIASRDGKVEGLFRDGALSVQVSKGDMIRWRELDLSLSFEHSVMFYDLIEGFPGQPQLQALSLGRPVLKGGISRKGKPLKIVQPLPRQPTPQQPDPPPEFLQVPYHYWETTVSQCGSEADLQWYFLITSNGNKAESYYKWQVCLHNTSD